MEEIDEEDGGVVNIMEPPVLWTSFLKNSSTSSWMIYLKVYMPFNLTINPCSGSKFLIELLQVCSITIFCKIYKKFLAETSLSESYLYLGE